jgi:hypothetical protein
LHLLATLRAAAPKQKLRRTPASSPAVARNRISLWPEDFHIQRFEQRSPSCLIFAIDASGSAALERLAEAKGAVEILLQQSYARRDSVCVLAFRGAKAEVLLPPTRSLVRAKRALAGLPGGGGTPLALALQLGLEPGQRRHDELGAGTLTGNQSHCRQECGGQMVNLRLPASRKHRHHRMVHRQPQGQTCRALVCLNGNHARQWVTHIGGRNAMLRQQSGFKREKAQHMVSTALDFLHPLRPGGPNRRADKLNRLDTGLAQRCFEVQIEVRRINANEHIRAPGQQLFF